MARASPLEDEVQCCRCGEAEAEAEVTSGRLEAAQVRGWPGA